MKNLKFSWTIGKDIYACVLSNLLAVIFLCACNNPSEKQQKDIDDLNAFVQRHKDSIDVFAHTEWSKMDSEFAAKRKDIERDTAKMDGGLKTSYYDAIRNWQDFQNSYSMKQAEGQKISEMDTIRKTLAINGIRPDFTDLTAQQILPAYEHFVNTVRNNKDNYTKEQWTVVNVSWKTLNGRKRELEKDIDAGLRAKITKLQLEYTGIKALNRPVAQNP
jgi:hypothetical protein